MTQRNLPKNKNAKSKRGSLLKRRLSAFARHVEKHLKLRRGSLLNQSTDENELLKPGQVTDYLGISPKTLANLRSMGTGPRYCKIGSRIFYRHADVLQYRRARQFKNTSQYRSGPQNGGLEQ